MRGAVVALVAVIALLRGVGVMAEPGGLRMLVFDLPYARVWENAVRAIGVYRSEERRVGKECRL